MLYKVSANKFHGGSLLYSGRSEAQAVKVARRHDCSECQCGGPVITRTDGASLLNWHAAKPFCPANEAFWQI